MLVLTRRINETIIINENIKITILGVNGCQVRLGIKAPVGVSVNREEIQKRIDYEKNNNNELVFDNYNR